MLKSTTFILFLLVYSFTASTQNPERDSLLRLLPGKAGDTTQVDLYRDIGITYIYENPPASIPYFKQAIVLAKKLKFDAGLERSFAATATAYIYSGKYDSSLAHVDTAIMYANIVGDINRQALVYLNRADVYTNMQRFSEALKDCDTAMTYAEKSGNDDRLARIYDIMSGVYIMQKQYTLALSFLEKAITKYKKLDNQQMIGLGLWSKATIYRETKKSEEAMPLLNEAILIAEKIGDIQDLSIYYVDLARLNIEKKDFSKAEPLAFKALQYAEQTGNRIQQAVCHALIANLYLEQNKLNQAITSGEVAYQMVKEDNDLIRQQQAATFLADAYEKIGNSKLAYNFLKISRDLNDSLLKKQFTKEIANLQTTFQVSEKEKEIQLLNKDKEIQKQTLSRQRILLFASISLIGLAIGGIFLLINRNRLRQQMKELELRNQIAADLHDEVGSSLSSIHMLSQIANKKQSEDIAQKEILDRMSNNAKETMEKMGDIVWMIKPGESEGSSLKNRMERFAQEICSNKNIDLNMELGKLETLKLSMPQRKNLYLIFKEALNNAAKYAETEKLDISSKEENKKLLFFIKDYGRGFDASSIIKGNGLDNMQNRAKELNGELNIISATGEGTTIQLTMPV